MSLVLVLPLLVEADGLFKPKRGNRKPALDLLLEGLGESLEAVREVVVESTFSLTILPSVIGPTSLPIVAEAVVVILRML